MMLPVKVIIAKLKKCPMLTAGTVSPALLEEWHHMCKCFAKQSSKDPKTKVVLLVANAMFEPRLQERYHTVEDWIDKLSLDEYMVKLVEIVLNPNWAHQMWQDILATSQPNWQTFKQWCCEMENHNALLTTSMPAFSLAKDSLHHHMEVHVCPSLCLLFLNKPIPSTYSYCEWAKEANTRDQDLRDEEKHMDDHLDSRNAVCCTCSSHTPQGSLLSRMSMLGTTTSTTASSGGEAKCTAGAPKLAKLTTEERSLLDKHWGCYFCHVFYVDHQSKSCLLATTGAWLDAATYVTLTEAMALPVRPTENKTSRLAVGYVRAQCNNVDTKNKYYSDKRYAPFTLPHLLVPLEVTGPHISAFPISIKALPDTGCPSTVISNELVTQLGLRHFELPQEEDNLSMLLGALMRSGEYVKLQMVLGNGAWSLGVHRAKVTTGLPVPLLLGIPFLALEHLIIDMELRSITVCDTGYDLAKPDMIPKHVWAPKYKIPPPTPTKLQKSKLLRPTMILKNVPPARLDASNFSCKMIAAVWKHIAVLRFLERCCAEEEKMKIEFADLFPTWLPDTADMPNHIYHHIHLKDKNLVMCRRGYSSAKNHHKNFWELMDIHIHAGCLHLSSSEHTSPCFVMPKYKNRVPDPTVLGHWVNNYQELNTNTIRNNFPLPKITDILADCGKGKIFSKIDMTNTFFQMQVHPDKIHLTAVWTP